MNNNKIALVIFSIALATAIFVLQTINPTWVEQRYLYPTATNEQGQLVYTERGQTHLIGDITPYANSVLRQENLNKISDQPQLKSQWVSLDNGDIALLKPDFHFGVWSLLPAIIAIALCLLTREPLPALLGGIVIGAVMLGKIDITGEVLQPTMATEGAAYILLLYLWLLGGLMGIWAKTGAAQAFADAMTQRFVSGPRSAKLVTWCLGMVFFQGGTVSTVLVGTTIRPLADKAKVSHEESSYVVDSTASPIASLIAFNAWPAYVQGLIFVPGVAFLATESDRIAFFFSSIPFSFYAMFAVIGTLLLSLNITRFSGPLLQRAHERAATTGQLDAPGARPISSKELHMATPPEHYQARAWEFLLPLVSLIVIAVVSFIALGSPKINWAFGIALLLSAGIALAKGMSLSEMLDGLGNGFKGVVTASVVLILAVAIGTLSKEVGGGLYLIELLGQQLPYWALPVVLQLLTMAIAFSTGTSWGTYAIAFPLAMPLAWVIAENQALANPEVFMAICFASVLNGSVFGDQCSPISDTSILSAMTTGCDLMDHIKSQLYPACLAALLAGICWTLSALLLSH